MFDQILTLFTGLEILHKLVFGSVMAGLVLVFIELVTGCFGKLCDEESE